MKRSTPILAALASAFLFGASTPAAKALIGEIHPVMLAGVLYAGSGLGLGLWIALRAGQPAKLPRADLPWLAAAVIAGGVIGPVALMLGLSSTSAASASLLLNLEGVFTALLAWFVFRENFDRRIVLGMALIVGGGVLLVLRPDQEIVSGAGALAVVIACLAWALDNNLTRRVSASDAALIAAIKGGAAGAVNLAIAIVLGAEWPKTVHLIAAGAIGLLGYGVSLAFFVYALRALGAARTGAYFSTAPFVGAALSIGILGESAGASIWIAGILMGIGVWLHVSERHEHEHVHEPMEHEHSHIHDEHHRHAHEHGWDGSEPHIHRHAHERLVHRHPHYPDLHHRHH